MKTIKLKFQLTSTIWCSNLSSNFCNSSLSRLSFIISSLLFALDGLILLFDSLLFDPLNLDAQTLHLVWLLLLNNLLGDTASSSRLDLWLVESARRLDGDMERWLLVVSFNLVELRLLNMLSVCADFNNFCKVSHSCLK